LITKDVLQTNNFHPSVSVLPVWERHCSIMDGNGTLSERFGCFEIPDYDVLYLGAGYAEKPIKRINEHIIQVGRMFTTSSYGITKKFAQTWTERVGFDLDSHPGAIDQVFGSFAHEFTYLCLQPRLTYQRKSYSDLNGGTNSYLQSMCDPEHENLV